VELPVAAIEARIQSEQSMKGLWAAAIRRIADPVVRELATGGEVRPYAKGEHLIREHEQGDALYVILAGRVKVYVADAQRRELVLAHYGAGDYVGEMALDGQPRSASVCALEPTVCAVVARDDLRTAIRGDPDIAMRMLATLIGRARSATGNLKNLALMDVYGRVARLLLEQDYEPGADGLQWSRERLTHQEIANRVGASRDMISRIFKDLRAGGYIAVRDKRIAILRRPPARW
jgi:CRP/FNR family cyclic AMP-dependent transcriptional regulator